MHEVSREERFFVDIEGAKALIYENQVRNDILRNQKDKLAIDLSEIRAQVATLEKEKMEFSDMDADSSVLESQLEALNLNITDIEQKLQEFQTEHKFTSKAEFEVHEYEPDDSTLAEVEADVLVQKAAIDAKCSTNKSGLMILDMEKNLTEVGQCFHSFFFMVL